MKLTKFSQSTFVVENAKGNRIVIDPGKYNYLQGFEPADFGRCDIMVVTHKHADHHDANAEKVICDLHSPVVLTNAEIAGNSPGYRAHAAGDIIEEHGFRIALIATDHFAKGESVLNFGMLIESDGKRFYHTSDTRFMEPQIVDMEAVRKCDALFVPISNRGVVMGIDDAIVFAAGVEPSVVIPGHCDSPKDMKRVTLEDYVARFEELKTRMDGLGHVKVHVMQFQDSLTL